MSQRSHLEILRPGTFKGHCHALVRVEYSKGYRKMMTHSETYYRLERHNVTRQNMASMCYEEQDKGPSSLCIWLWSREVNFEIFGVIYVRQVPVPLMCSGSRSLVLQQDNLGIQTLLAPRNLSW